MAGALTLHGLPSRTHLRHTGWWQLLHLLLVRLPQGNTVSHSTLSVRLAATIQRVHEGAAAGLMHSVAGAAGGDDLPLMRRRVDEMADVGTGGGGVARVGVEVWVLPEWAARPGKALEIDCLLVRSLSASLSAGSRLYLPTMGVVAASTRLEPSSSSLAAT
jgi:hypothetical protein